MAQVEVHSIPYRLTLFLGGFRSSGQPGFSLLSTEAVARVLVQVHDTNHGPFQAFFGFLGLAVVKPIQPWSMATALFAKGAIYHSNLDSRPGAMLFNELLIDGFKPDASAVVIPVSPLTQLAVAAQVRIIRFATND